MIKTSNLFEPPYSGCSLSQMNTDLIQFSLPLFEEYHLQMFSIPCNVIL